LVAVVQAPGPAGGGSRSAGPFGKRRAWSFIEWQATPVRALVQRVSEAAVTVEGEEVARIGPGLLVLLGVRAGDTTHHADRIAGKLRRLRIFEDAERRMNLSVDDVNGEVLCVSQFTLYGDVRKGNRPSFIDAAVPEQAEPLYERVCQGLEAQRGAFGARMEVSLVNDGPVTLLLEA
jgi:D-aminoacyl-tRNA deacylase